MDNKRLRGSDEEPTNGHKDPDEKDDESEVPQGNPIIRLETAVAPTYVRTRHNNLRCFPRCSPFHMDQRFCGRALEISTVPIPDERMRNVLVFAEFRNSNDRPTFSTGDSCPAAMVTKLGERLMPAEYLRRTGNRDRFVIHPPRKWHYPGKLRTSDRHQVHGYIVIDDVVIGTTSSSPFDVVPIWKTDEKAADPAEDGSRHTQGGNEDDNDEEQEFATGQPALSQSDVPVIPASQPFQDSNPSNSAALLGQQIIPSAPSFSYGLQPALMHVYPVSGMHMPQQQHQLHSIMETLQHQQLHPPYLPPTSSSSSLVPPSALFQGEAFRLMQPASPIFQPSIQPIPPAEMLPYPAQQSMINHPQLHARVPVLGSGGWVPPPVAMPTMAIPSSLQGMNTQLGTRAQSAQPLPQPALYSIPNFIPMSNPSTQPRQPWSQPFQPPGPPPPM